MSGFRESSQDVSGWLALEADPDNDTAHQTILDWLLNTGTPNFLKSSEPLLNTTKGNLGEFIAYKLGKRYIFTNDETAHAANAWDPLSQNSRPDVDIVWLHIGETETEDWAALQEVKTTGESSLNLADGLTKDYDKLFGENPRLSLQTRLGALKNKLEQQGQGHLSYRVTALGGPNPSLTRGILLVPTLVHDAGNSSFTKMIAIREILIGKGWPHNVVKCFSIALADLDNRLCRLARGQP